MPTLAELAGDAFAAIADALPDVPASVGYRIRRANQAHAASFPVRALVTEGDTALVMTADAVAPTDAPTKVIRVLDRDWPQPTPPRVDDEVQLAGAEVYRVRAVEHRIGGYWLITASLRKGAKW